MKGNKMPKVWLITGCTRGFGKILVQELLDNTDARVIRTGRNLKDLDRPYPGRLLSLNLDVRHTQAIQQVVSQGLAEFGRIDVLVNNAGYGLMGALEECSPGAIRDIFETNVFGLMEMTRAVLPPMRTQKSGHIFNISSVAGLVANPGGGIYNSTKFAIEGFSEALKQDVANLGIRVTLMEPGPFRTDFAGSSIVMAPPMNAYAHTDAAAIRSYIAKANGAQPGDPLKAMRILIQLSDMENPPLRMPLGKVAYERIQGKESLQREEFERFKTLGLSADYGA